MGDNVYSRNYGQGAKHLPGEVVDKQGSVTYGVLLRDQRYVRRHANQLFPRLKENRGAGVMDGTSQLHPVETEKTGEKSLSVPRSREIMEETREIPEFTPPPDSPRGGHLDLQPEANTTVPVEAVDKPFLRRSSREIKRPRTLIEEV